VRQPIRRILDPRGPDRVGEAPDYRFSLANERTFLAWIRTALALVGAGLAIGFLPALRMPHLGDILTVTLLLVGATVAARALVEWSRTEEAMRLGEDLPPARLPAFLALVVSTGAVILAVAVLVAAIRG
jgi:putative membrane protein